ncbi:MAG: integration host factor subunit alpha [Gammaproteobacteria bacterium]|jgi:integration host factor subunit alpha|nr:integration host factor subunit alpha [Gammaproteobacteria bacterium]
MTLTKAELTNKLCKEVDMLQGDAKEFVNSFFDEVRSLLAEGFSIKLSGFGNFELREKAARPGRNPKTGEAAVVSARRVVTFKSGQKFKKIVAG